MAPPKKTPDDTSVDRALAALATETGDRRVRVHLAGIGANAEAGSNIAIEDLVEAFKEFRRRSRV